MEQSVQKFRINRMSTRNSPTAFGHTSPERLLEGKNENTMSAFIELEVKRFLSSNRVTDTGLRELDTRIQFEAFRREKMDAIATDKKEGIDIDDARSNTSKVQAKYDGMADALIEARNQRENATMRSSMRDGFSYKSNRTGSIAEILSQAHASCKVPSMTASRASKRMSSMVMDNQSLCSSMISDIKSEFDEYEAI